MKGIENFLFLVNENWTTITVIIGLSIMLYRKVESYLKKSEEEKILIAKQQIKEVVLRLVSEAEADYSDWYQAGSIKRSQVIQEIFKEYPVLEKVVDQESLVKFIDEAINESLVVLREVIEKNEDSFVITTKEDK
jgi:hypothetical protein